MNTCQYQAQLQSYHDNQLPLDQAASIKAHLPTCASCQSEFDSLVRTGDLMGELFVDANLPQLRPLALAQVHQQLDKRIDLLNDQLAEQSSFRLAKWLTAVAACVLLASSVQLFFVQSGVTNPGKTYDVAPNLAWETTSAMLDQENAAGPAVSNEYSLAAWIVSDLSAARSSSATPMTTQE